MRARWTIVVVALSVVVACDDSPVEPAVAGDSRAGEWRTWVIANGAALRPSPPPSNAAAELDEIVAMQQTVTPAEDAMIHKWNTQPTTVWHDVALDLFGFYWILLPDVRLATPARSARAFALLHAAMYDALVATWYAKYEFDRPAPTRADSRVRAFVPVADVPSYPSEHAASAAAAAAVLRYLFPNEDTASFSALAREAGEARIVAGAAYRSDVDAGYAIGRAVAEAVIARARADGSDAPWTGAVPTGASMWRPTPPRDVENPFDPTAPSWRTWVIPSGSVFRPPPPPALGSPAFTADIDELRQLSTSRTVAQADTARFWASESPSSRWEVFMRDEIERRDLTPMRAARALALASIATYDAMVACWDAKYFYWLLRPVSADPSIKTVFSTPPFPSYPSGHSTLSSAVGEVFAYLFPDAADHYRRKGFEASMSRILAGVHYRFDVLEGEHLGLEVGEAVVEWARQDGANP
jgi:membrane-associated phospholipid phosphatase